MRLISTKILINQGNLYVDQIIVKNKKKTNNNIYILLIDEVDVFFGESFYGKTFNPAIKLQNQLIIELLKFIWETGKPRGGEPEPREQIVEKVESQKCYKELIGKYQDWKTILDYHIQRMIDDVLSLSNKDLKHDYMQGFIFFL